jgi:hypothetical protein
LVPIYEQINLLNIFYRNFNGQGSPPYVLDKPWELIIVLLLIAGITGYTLYTIYSERKRDKPYDDISGIM